jgi:FkbM family methyltransferase
MLSGRFEERPDWGRFVEGRYVQHMISRHTIKAALESAPPWFSALLRVMIIWPLRAYIRFAPWRLGRLLLYEKVASHLWWLETRVSCRTRFGAVLGVDASDIVGKHIYYFGVWEPRLTDWIRERLKPGDLFVDVGANVGYFTVLASKLVGMPGKVVAIEALPEIFSRLRENITRNCGNNVRAANVAAWNKVEELTIFARKGHPSGVTTVMREWADEWALTDQVEIQARPLGMILTQQEMQSVRLIKIDVEGAEWPVVFEMKSWLPFTSDNLEIVIEVSRRMLQAHDKTFSDVVSLFREFAFSCYRVQNDYLASSCIGGASGSLPFIEPVVDWPDSLVDQVDLIFSRTTDLQLPVAGTSAECRSG